jgi:hypothetical protein
MSAGTHGFGALTYPGLSDPDAMPMPEGPDPQQASDDLHRLAEKFDGPPIEDITIFNIAAGKAVKLDFSAVDSPPLR